MTMIRKFNYALILVGLASTLGAHAGFASFDRCVQGRDNVRDSEYIARLKQSGKECVGYHKKYPRGQDMSADPCYGGAPVCKEALGVFETKDECGDVAWNKNGTPEQIDKAQEVLGELIDKWNGVCPMAQ
jgi:hypothetical protein